MTNAQTIKDQAQTIAELKAANKELQRKVNELGSRLAMHLDICPEKFWGTEAEDETESIN